MAAATLSVGLPWALAGRCWRGRVEGTDSVSLPAAARAGTFESCICRHSNFEPYASEGIPMAWDYSTSSALRRSTVTGRNFFEAEDAAAASGSESLTPPAATRLAAFAANFSAERLRISSWACAMPLARDRTYG